MKIQFNIKYFIIFSILFITEVLIALYVHDSFIRPFIGDILVVILIYTFIKSFTNITSIFLPIYIFVFSFTIELLQYINIVKLLNLEDNPILSVIIGQTFDIKDILCYFIGCTLLLIVNLKKPRD